MALRHKGISDINIKKSTSGVTVTIEFFLSSFFFSFF